MASIHIAEFDENASLIVHRALHCQAAPKACAAPAPKPDAGEEWTVLDASRAAEEKEELVELESEPEPASPADASALASASCMIEGIEGVSVDIISVPVASQPQAAQECASSRSISSQVLEAVSETISPELKTIYPVILVNDITMDPNALLCKETKEKDSHQHAQTLASGHAASECSDNSEVARPGCQTASKPPCPPAKSSLGSSCSIF